MPKYNSLRLHAVFLFQVRPTAFSVQFEKTVQAAIFLVT